MDFALGTTFDFKFTSRNSSGVPTTLTSGTVVVYEDNSVVEITTGITLSADFDSRTGLNNLRIVATSGNGYEAGKSYAAVLSAGTVSGSSVVGETILNFTINRANVGSFNSNSNAVNNLALSAGVILPGSVDTAINGHTPTTTEFQSDTFSEITTDHYVDRVVIWTSGNLLGQATEITGYSTVTGVGQFTVNAMTEAPADNDTFIIV